MKVENTVIVYKMLLIEKGTFETYTSLMTH